MIGAFGNSQGSTFHRTVIGPARLASAGGLESQIQQAYRLALNRRPTGAEMQMLAPFAQKYGMPNLCRLIFNTSEFMFVD